MKETAYGSVLVIVDSVELKRVSKYARYKWAIEVERECSDKKVSREVCDNKTRWIYRQRE